MEIVLPPLGLIIGCSSPRYHTEYFVTELLTPGPAKDSGSIQIGDSVIAVNGKLIPANLSPEEIESIFVPEDEQDERVFLSLKNKNDGTPYVVQLRPMKFKTELSSDANIAVYSSIPPILSDLAATKRIELLNHMQAEITALYDLSTSAQGDIRSLLDLLSAACQDLGALHEFESESETSKRVDDELEIQCSLLQVLRSSFSVVDETPGYLVAVCCSRMLALIDDWRFYLENLVLTHLHNGDIADAKKVAASLVGAAVVYSRRQLNIISPTHTAGEEGWDLHEFNLNHNNNNNNNNNNNKKQKGLNSMEDIIQSVHQCALVGDVITMTQVFNIYGFGKENFLNSALPPDNKTPLHKAVKNHHRAAVALLLATKAFPNAKDAEGLTPLHEAAKIGDTKMMGMLLFAGADAAAKDSTNRSILHCAASSGKNAGEAVDFILRRCRQSKFLTTAVDDLGMTPLHLAAASPAYPAVRKLLESHKGVDGSSRLTFLADAAGRTALHCAVSAPLDKSSEIAMIISRLVDDCGVRGRELVEARDWQGMTALDVAVARTNRCSQTLASSALEVLNALRAAVLLSKEKWATQSQRSSPRTVGGGNRDDDDDGEEEEAVVEGEIVDIDSKNYRISFYPNNNNINNDNNNNNGLIDAEDDYGDDFEDKNDLEASVQSLAVHDAAVEWSLHRSQETPPLSVENSSFQERISVLEEELRISRMEKVQSETCSGIELAKLTSQLYQSDARIQELTRDLHEMDHVHASELKQARAQAAKAVGDAAEMRSYIALMQSEQAMSIERTLNQHLEKAQSSNGTELETQVTALTQRVQTLEMELRLTRSLLQAERQHIIDLQSNPTIHL